MKQPTIEYSSGSEVNLAAVLLTMASPDVGHPRTHSIEPERFWVSDSVSPSSHSQKGEKP